MKQIVTIIALATLLSGATAGLLKQCSQIRNGLNREEELAEGLGQANQEAKRYENALGNETISRKQLQVTHASFKAILGNRYDSVVKASGAKDKQIQSYSRTEFRLKAENLRLRLQPAEIIYIIDSLGDSTFAKAQSFIHREKYFELGGSVIDGVMLRIDSIVMQSGPIDMFVTYQRKKGKLFGSRRTWLPRFGPKEYEFRMTAENKMLRIGDIRSYNVVKR